MALPRCSKLRREWIAAPSKVQLIFLCGHNVELAEKIRNLGLAMPAVVEEFTTRVDYFMSLSDFFIGKPGPGSISEALHFGLPVIVERNSRTLPQERYNGTWLTEEQLGIVVPDFAEISPVVGQLLANSKLRDLQENVARYENYAIFEIPLILDRVHGSQSHGNLASSHDAGFHGFVCQSSLGWIDAMKPKSEHWQRASVPGESSLDSISLSRHIAVSPNLFRHRDDRMRTAILPPVPA